MASTNEVDVECHTGESDHQMDDENNSDDDVIESISITKRDEDDEKAVEYVTPGNDAKNKEICDEQHNDETKQLMNEIVNTLIENAARTVDVHRGHLRHNEIQTLSQIEEILIQNDVQIDNVQMERLRGIWKQCGHDLNQFITVLIDLCYSVDDKDSAPLLPHRMVQMILHKFIKNTDLNTENVVRIASILIPKLDPNGNVDIDEVTAILVENAISGRVFVKGTSEYINAGKFSRLFKSLSSWKDNKSVFSRFWKKMYKWELVEGIRSQKTRNVNQSKVNQNEVEEQSEDHNRDECKYQISECPQCQNIKSMLIKYQSKNITAPKQKKQESQHHSMSISQSSTGLASFGDDDPLAVTVIFNDEYTAVNLMDDYHHLIHDHGVGHDASRLRECSKSIARSISCNLSECEFARRHYGRRRGSQQSTGVTYDDDWRDDILQQIHCHMLHSIDFSELSRPQQADIEMKIPENRDVKNNDDEQNPVDANDSNGVGSKFVSDGQPDADGDTEYTEGIRYWYWTPNHFMPKSAVPVTRKYHDLKEEMVSGGHISIHAWNRLVKLCLELIGTKFGKNITANGIGQDIYDIKAGIAFDVAHLLALKLYTDFDDLNHLFCDQYRINDANKDHSEWWNMGKLLTECVQCFGKLLISKKVKYYRGLSKPFVFSRFVARFNAPLSTSKSVCCVLQHLFQCTHY